MRKIPVTVITGFLGAGKTTLVRHLLQSPQSQGLAVLVNEFGEVGIDGSLLSNCCDTPVVELTNGCLCCTVQEEFLPTMQMLLNRPTPPTAIVIETSGLALPKPLVQAFTWPGIRTRTTVDGVITVVDGESLHTGQLARYYREGVPLTEHDTPLGELLADQLACADLVLLNKVDTLTPEQQTQLMAWLKTQVRPGVSILPCQYGQVPVSVLLDLGMAVEDHLAERPSHHDQDHDEEDHDPSLRAVVLTADDIPHPEWLVQRLTALVQQYEIYRAKGWAVVAGKPMRLVVQGVGTRLQTYYDRPWRPDEPRRTQVVCIGRNLPLDLAL
ncbi:MAG: cobalamin biosynthesis protein CobW [Gloeomargarita sp. GMQP_bins_120]